VRDSGLIGLDARRAPLFLHGVLSNMNLPQGVSSFLHKETSLRKNA
jgi:hypothetical protein